LISISGKIGNVGLYTLSEKAFIGGAVGICRLLENTNGKFVMQELLSENGQKYFQSLIKASSHQNITIEDVRNIEIDMPSEAEQNKISTYFGNLDHLITLHQRKCEETKKLKKYMLQKMFPKNGECVPEIRFAGYTDAWEQRKLGELYQRNTERNSELIGYDKTISVATMNFKDEGNGASEDSLSTYKVLRIGDIAFEGHTNKQFRYGRFVVNDIGTGIMSPRFSTLRPIKEMSVEFWKQYIHYEPVMRKVLVNSTKAGTMMNELVIPEFLEQEIRVPSDKEQKKIGAYFSALDHLITLHQRKYEELQNIKKFMLQNMFV
jgi:type I restriction enzyme S subunit